MNDARSDPATEEAQSAGAEAEGRTSPPWIRAGMTRGAVFGSLVVLVAAASGAAALSDNSFLTHLTTGRRMLDGHLPSTDPYSFTAHGQPWVIQSWFASLLYALTERVGSGMGVRLMIATLSGVIAAVVWRLTRPGGTVLTRFAAVTPAILVGTLAWGARPLIFGLAGFVLLLLVLTEERDPRWLVPVMWLWVNMHGSFPLALVLIVVYGFGVWCDKGPLDHVIRTLKWCVAGVLLGAVNPLGPKLLWFPVELLTKQDVLSNMIEWQAPTFTSTWQRIFLVSIVVAVALVPRLPAGRRYRVLLPALVFTALGLTASRNIALATVLLAPLLAAELAGLGSLVSDARSRTYTIACGVLAAATVVVVGARVAGPTFDFSPYPVAAIDWLEEEGRLGPDHRIAARDFVGNYLEFRTEGRTRIFIDDRVDMFPARIVADQAKLLTGRAGWDEVLDRWNVDTVVWDENEALASLLTVAPDWRLIRSFESPDSSTTWVVFQRAGSPGR